jgi:hypothetical protein
MTSDQTFNESLITRLIGKVLPDRMKRIIFVSSLVAHINDCKNPDKELLSKINTLLTLSGERGALVLPMKMHSQIWDKVELIEVFTSKNIPIDDIHQIAEYKFVKNQARLVSEELVKRTPRWLRYASNTQMRSDLIKVFNNMENLLQPKLSA